MEDIDHSIWNAEQYAADLKRPQQQPRPIWKPSASNERWMGN